jgi:DNA-binding NtrC family response regulator
MGHDRRPAPQPTIASGLTLALGTTEGTGFGDGPAAAERAMDRERLAIWMEDLSAGADHAGAVDLATAFDLAARSSVNIMLTGATGAARKSWAATIHHRSARGCGPFVAVRARSRPTRSRANHQRVDHWFERAAGGSLFIDQIGQLGRDDQERLFWRLTEQSRADGEAAPGQVRIVSGTGRLLRADVENGSFQEALFYRLNVIHITTLGERARNRCTTRSR